jgi:exodeoxyribonuclease VII large subunit
MEQLSLQELNELVKATLDTHLEPSYWVVAEIGELRVNQRGHCYMELVQKDEDQLIAKIRGNIWAYTYRNLSGWFEATTGQSLKPGLKILVNAMVQFHEVYGISLTIRDIDPSFTLGERAKKRQEIIGRLKDEDLLDKNKTCSLPLVPQRIAVISSPTAAGFGDFQDQLSSNPYGYRFQIKLFKSIMQGDEAIEGITVALDLIEQNRAVYDLVVIIRGGGSQVDLDCFDSYDVCAKIAKSKLPVITGIGHERDETIADLVAHTRLKTPTAVSEFLVNGIAQYEVILDDYHSRIRNSFNEILRIEGLKLQDFQHQLKQLFHMALKSKDYKLTTIEGKLISSARMNLNARQTQVENLTVRLSLLDPEKIMKRGYTITSINNKLLSKSKSIKKGDKLKTYTDKLVINSTVDHSDKK